MQSVLTAGYPPAPAEQNKLRLDLGWSFCIPQTPNTSTGGREMVFAIFSGDPARRDAVPVALRESPEGGEGWTKRARRLQGQLISRWAGIYG